MENMAGFCAVIGIMIGVFALPSCNPKDSSPSNEFKDSNKGPEYSKAACFEAGGVEYQLGVSGGTKHVVCIFKK